MKSQIAAFLTRRARWVVGIWILAVFLLANLGKDLQQEISIRPKYIEGTQSARAHEISQREFGNEYAMVVLLRGPQSAVERQGQRLASRLGETPGLLVVSPWSAGAAVKGLRPAPGEVALLVRSQSTEDEGVSGLLKPVERQVDATIAGPVHPSFAGFPVVFESLRHASEDAAALGELIALPVLLLVLLLVFRSVFAALIPVVIGGSVVAATQGVLKLCLGLVEIDPIAIVVSAMMGLALGVDYTLLVISRFREEREGREAIDAAQAVVGATARSIVPAGCGLMVAMIAAILVMPGLASVAIAVSSVTVLSMLSALCVVPALLTLIGDRLDRWSLPKRRFSQPAPLRWSRRVTARPRAVVSIVIVLLLLASLAFTLDSGVNSIALLPSGDSGRKQLEAVERALGPGWSAPIEVVVNGRGQPVTSPSRLRALASFQRQAERDPGVETMAGFARISSGAEQLTGVRRTLAKQERGLERLDTGIGRLHRGTVLNTRGLLAGAEGARQLASGAGTANEGAGLLADSLQAVSTGSSRLTQGLGRADDGSGELAQGTTKASSGAGRLADALERSRGKTGEISASARLIENAMRSGNDRLAELHDPVRGTGDQLAAAWQALQGMTTGRSDPQYAAALHAVEEANRQLSGNDIRTGEQLDPSYAGVLKGIERAEGQFGVGLYLSSSLEESGHRAQEGMEKLARASARLDRGLQRLAVGSRKLTAGVAQLSDGGERLSPALQQLSAGAERLSTGLGRLGDGTSQLADGLGGGAQKSKLLTGGLRRIAMGLERQQDSGGGGQNRLFAQSPGLFRSGYFVLAALDGSRPVRRDQLGFLVNLDRGGLAARMLIVPRDDPMSAVGEETRERLEEDAGDLARRTGAEVVVGGVGPAEIDTNHWLREQALILRLVLSLVTFLVLVPVVRSLTIPILAALLNLVTVSACFGLLSLLFDSSLLGGPGFIDVSVIPGTMIVMFGLAIDYEVFVFARMREEYVRTGSPSQAITAGLDRTAPIITGAALIMIGVFLAFSVSPFMTIRNFGVAQAVGVFIDAFIVRLIVIPAAMTRLGRWSWWMPGWLDRLLPGGGEKAPIAQGPSQVEPAEA